MARRAGFWAGLTFFLTIVAVSATIWMVRGAMAAAEQASNEHALAEEQKKQSVVSDEFRAEAKAYVDAYDSESHAPENGYKAFLAAKKNADDAWAAVKPNTDHERNIAMDIEGDRVVFETCVDGALGQYHVESLRECKAYLDVDKSRAALNK